MLCRPMGLDLRDICHNSSRRNVELQSDSKFIEVNCYRITSLHPNHAKCFDTRCVSTSGIPLDTWISGSRRNIDLQPGSKFVEVNCYRITSLHPNHAKCFIARFVSTSGIPLYVWISGSRRNIDLQTDSKLVEVSSLWRAFHMSPIHNKSLLSSACWLQCAFSASKPSVPWGIVYDTKQRDWLSEYMLHTNMT
jgi:hypothetical protein